MEDHQYPSNTNVWRIFADAVSLQTQHLHRHPGHQHLSPGGTGIGAGIKSDALAIIKQILAGNASDKRWNPEAALEMKKFFDDRDFKNIIFVFDCATVYSI